MAQTIAEQAVDTRLLVGILSKAAIGQEFTYQRLSAELGRKIVGNDSNLMSARKIVQRDFDIVFDVQRGHGIRRLSDPEIVALGDRLTGKVRRAARRTVRQVSLARDEHLSKDEIVHRNAVVSMAGAIMHMATRSNVAKLESAVRVNAAELPVGKTLELFKS